MLVFVNVSIDKYLFFACSASGIKFYRHGGQNLWDRVLDKRVYLKLLYIDVTSDNA